MKFLVLNILLGFVWMFLNGNLDFINFIEGFAVGFIILWMSTYAKSSSRYFGKIPKVFNFVFYFIYELIVANIKVAYDILTPRHRMNPAVFAVPLDVKTDIEITLLANVITLTPGTLSLDVSNDKKVLYVHAAYVKDREEFVREIKEGFEKKLMEIFE
ncbi:MAG: Na+/H+ antiporter subunit E [Melioribacteraceae bacterium]|nr:Na+/H+ antiporter subunit E [Melioribacteraceae bacterium]